MAFLFWGWMSGHLVTGLGAAVLVEAPRWTRLRWDFNEAAFMRAWHLTVVLILFGAISVWLDGPSSRRVYDLFTWMPVLLLPIQFVQSYGTRTSVPLHVFAIAARSRIERERKLGRIVEVPEIAFGNVLVVALLLGAALGREADHWLFVPGALLLVGWALRRTRGQRGAWLPWLASLLAVATLGMAGQAAVRNFHDWLVGGALGVGADDGTGFRFTQLQLGGLRDQKNTARIFWRLGGFKGPPPMLLRTASFNSYRSGFWQFRPRPEIEIFPELGFTTTAAGVPYRIAGDHAVRNPAPAELPSFNLRGAVRRNTLVPLPHGVRSLREIQADDLEANALGTVRITPIHPVLDTVVTWGDSYDLDAPPWTGDELSPDLRVPLDEVDAVRQVVDQFGLRNGHLNEKIIKLRGLFVRHFRYTRYLAVRPPTTGPSPNPAAGAIGRFLTSHRSGHCEYFATATALLLREAGVPARYTVGFAAVEHSLGLDEIVVRGTHAHAWCRAWDERQERWLDVDLTPPDWTVRESTTPGWPQRLVDSWQELREDVLAWRTRPGNLDRLTLGMVLGGSLAAAYILTHLWRSRQREVKHAASLRHHDRLPAGLRRLVRAAGRRIGPRPPGMPLGTWLGRLAGGDPGLAELIALHARLRFDPAGPSPGDEVRLTELAASLVARWRRRQAENG